MSDVFAASYVVLWALVIASVLALLGTARQVAVLTARLPADEPVEFPGPNLGTVAPEIHGSDIGGRDVTLRPPFAQKTAFVFVSDSCDACNTLIPQLEELVLEAPSSDIRVIMRDAPESGHRLLGPLASRLVLSRSAEKVWGIESVPYAFIARPDGTLEAKGNLPHIQRLRSGLGLDPTDEGEASEHVEAWLT